MKFLCLESLSTLEREMLLNRSGPLDDEVKARVAKIIAEVRNRGDDTLKAFSRQFDLVRIENFRIALSELQRAFERIDDRARAAMGQAKLQLEKFHERQLPEPYEIETEPGVTLGRTVRPFARVGVYAPKNLVSSLLMAAVPARLAGVCRLVACTPPAPNGAVPDVMLAAAALLDVEEFYAVGGAHAVAALAYGTESIEPVDKIVGPGNAYVTAAKALVRDEVGIDLLAGPSEVLIVIEPDEAFSLEQLTRLALAELRAQLEHGPGASALLLTSIGTLAERVAKQITPEELRERNVAILTYASLDAAIDFVNDYAPEHLCLWGAKAEDRLQAVRHAGSVFLGHWSPVALGDYASGTNHVLPTARQARLTGGLSVQDFYKSISYQRLDAKGLAALADTAVTLAELEGMAAHAASVRARFGEATP